jgi:hypothetical protein
MTALDFPTSPSNGDTYENYVYDSTDGVWKRIASGIELNGISDVTLSSPTDGQALVYDNATSSWVNETPATTLDSLTDADLTTPVAGDTLVYDGTNWVNGPRSHNAVINGDFGIWQRGTSFSGDEYTADRFRVLFNASCTTTRESFSAGDIETIGYGDAEFYLRGAFTGVETDRRILYGVEDVRSFAGQTVTFSFWAKSATSDAISEIRLRQLFGSGGSTTVNTYLTVPTLTSSWARYSATVAVPSVAGKTIGANNYLGIQMNFKADTDVTIDTWGWQLEAGSVATPFRLAGGGSKAAELAECQRYYQTFGGGSLTNLCFGAAFSTTQTFHVLHLPSTMRVAPSASFAAASNYKVSNSSGGGVTCTVVSAGLVSTSYLTVYGTVSSGLSAGNGSSFQIDSGGYVNLSAEL